MTKLGSVLALAAVALSAAAAAQDSLSAPARSQQDDIERGRDSTRLLLAGDSAALAARMSPRFLAAIGGVPGLERFLEDVRISLGPELAVEEELTIGEGIVTHYYRRSRFEKLPNVTVYWAIDELGGLQGGLVRPTQPAAATQHLGYRTKASLRLPFTAPDEGRWYVGWGGRDVIHNYHAEAPDQRFAYDLYVMVLGRPFRTDGETAEDYYCFGKVILAPAAGTVVTTVDGLPDNAPARMDRANPVGNHVVIDHGGEFSFLAHLRNGSVAVKPGDTVSAGQPIGRCGNSGNSSMPHLHYHLQTTGVFAHGEGLPAQFNHYRSNGQQVERGEPVRGQYLEP